MSVVTEALMNLFSLTGLFAFLLGVGATKGYYQMRCHWLDHRDPEHKPHARKTRGLLVMWALIILMTVVTGVQGYETANQVRKLAADTKACQREFNTALVARSTVAAENDKWSSIQRRAIADWFHEILLPPADIAEIRSKDPDFGSNPRYVQWSIDVTSKYYNIIQKAQDEQDENIRTRPALPDPSCGK